MPETAGTTPERRYFNTNAGGSPAGMTYQAAPVGGPPIPETRWRYRHLRASLLIALGCAFVSGLCAGVIVGTVVHG